MNTIMTNNKILTMRETEILQLIADGNTDREIAALLSLSAKTINTHRKNMLRKLNLKNTALLIRHALENKIVK